MRLSEIDRINVELQAHKEITSRKTLRDEFAMMTYSGLMDIVDNNTSLQHLAKMCYATADEMLKAREVTK